MTNEMNRDPEQKSGLIRRLRNHLAMMAPHQKEKATGKLLTEATEDLERCERIKEEQLFSNPPNITNNEAVVCLTNVLDKIEGIEKRLDHVETSLRQRADLIEEETYKGPKTYPVSKKLREESGHSLF